MYYQRILWNNETKANFFKLGENRHLEILQGSVQVSLGPHCCIRFCLFPAFTGSIKMYIFIIYNVIKCVHFIRISEEIQHFYS